MCPWVASSQDHLRYGNCFTLGQFGDGVGQVDILDIIGTSGHPQTVRRGVPEPMPARAPVKRRG